MSGTRRNQIFNLNASDHHTLQQSQVGSALALYRQPVQPVSTPSNHNATATLQAAPRPTVIQYTVPQHPPSHHPQARSQYPSQIPTQTRALPPPSPTTTRVTPTTDFAMGRRLLQSIVTAITPTITEHEKSVAAAVNKVEKSVENFVSDVKEARTETDKWLIQLTEAMQKSLQIQQTQTKAVNKRIEKLEALIMASFDRNDEMSLVSRLENIQYTVGELSERVKDPGAQDLFMAPQVTQTVNEVRSIPTPPESVEGRALTPIRRMYEDRSTSCDIPELSPERAPSHSRLLYKDAASDVVDLEPELPVMMSPVRLEYNDVGNDPRSPSPPHGVQRMPRSSSFEPPSGSDSETNCPRPSISGFHGKSSEVIPEFETDLHINNTEEDSIFTTHSEGDESLLMAHSEDRDSIVMTCPEGDDSVLMAHPEGDDLMVFDDDTSVAIGSHVESKPEPIKLMVDDEVYDDAQVNHERESNFAAPAAAIIFSRSSTPIEDTNAALAQMADSDLAAPAIVEGELTTPSRSLTPPEGSVAALRQTVVSSREAFVVTPPQERYSLPSSATAPSAPASPKCSPSPRAISIPATTTSQLTQRRLVFTVSSPTLSSISEHERGVSLSIAKSDYAEPMAMQVPTSPTPESAPPPKVNLSPYSDDRSESSVSRMMTVPASEEPELSGPSLSSLEIAVHECVEQPQEQVSMPLFLPELRSQSPPPPQQNDTRYESFESPLPSPKPTYITPSKSQSMRPTTPVALTSPIKPPATIFNTPYNKLKLNRRKSDRSIISIKSTPQKSPATIMRPVLVQSTRPPATPRLKSEPETIFVHSSPNLIPSRLLSPFSVLDSASESEPSDAGSDVVRVIRKKEPKKGESSKSKAKIQLDSSASASASVGPCNLSKTTQRINLLEKLQAKKRESAAFTRVRKRKAPTTEQMEPPLKRARQKASVSAPVPTPPAEVERGSHLKRERMSFGSSKTRAGGGGKTRVKEIGREDDKGYRLTNNTTKTPPVTDDKKLRPRALPVGVNWPQKNESGDKRFDNQFIECEKCYLWYHYGCIGIMDSNDPVAIGDKTFICPPCLGGGANPMLPSDNIICARPDCEKEEKKEDEYFMTAIIGRHTKVSSGTGRKYLWLVKWDGYSIRECTWEEEDGMSDPHSFIQDFNRKAKREGKDPDEDPYSTVLLREAILGGWTDPNA